MSKDFITIDVRKPEYKIVEQAFSVYLDEGGHHYSSFTIEEIRYTLYKLGFGDLVEEFLLQKEITAEIPYEQTEDPIVPVPSHPLEEETDGQLENVSRLPRHVSPKY